MMANGFGANESDREPSKSISALFEVVGKTEEFGAAVAAGAAVIRKDMMSVITKAVAKKAQPHLLITIFFPQYMKFHPITNHSTSHLHAEGFQ